ncbi:SX2_G0009740.mRNA.1.CDS.1 [Saccharomyces cerevisiae]|nr:SX2_G0009740.mRNA.1.CDS.1 [Saccharomyces cerevisiae]
MMIIIFIELCRIADSLLWIPKSSRRTSSIFYIPNIIALLKMESQQLSQNSPTLRATVNRKIVSSTLTGVVYFLYLCLFTK